MKQFTSLAAATAFTFVTLFGAAAPANAALSKKEKIALGLIGLAVAGAVVHKIKCERRAQKCENGKLGACVKFITRC